MGKAIGEMNSETGAKVYRAWANAIAVFNRIPAPFPITDDSQDTTRAMDLPLGVLLPDTEDWTMLMRRMVVLISRTLMAHVPCFKELTTQVAKHIDHEHSELSSRKSEVVSKCLLLHVKDALLIKLKVF